MNFNENMKTLYFLGTAFIFAIVSFGAGFGAGFAQDRVLKEHRVVNAYMRSLPPVLSGDGRAEHTSTAARDNTPVHYAPFANGRTFFEDAYRRAAPMPDMQKEAIRGALVNHHLLAPHLIARVFSALATKESRVVVLVSPDHFMRGTGAITLSAIDWQTPYGILKTDEAIVSRLADAGVGAVDEKPFESAPGRVEGEHGIANIVPFIKRSIPNARFVPIIIKDTLSPKDGAIFAKRLDMILPEDALVIASLDFSHTLPPLAAEFHDAKSVAVLANFDEHGTEFLDVDSKPSTRILLSLMKLRGASEFHIFDHTNSAKILDDFTIPDATSYITGVFTDKKSDARPQEQVTLLAFGDMMLDRYVHRAIEEHGVSYPFQKIERFLGGNDITLANLEGGFTDFLPKPLVKDNTVFTFDPSLIPHLNKVGFTLFNLANNHSRDFGAEGFAQTRAYLSKNNIAFFGDWRNENGLTTIQEIRGHKIGFVGYHELSRMGFENAIAEVKKFKDAADIDRIVVYTHWGVEYERQFSKHQQSAAYAFIDAGADVVIGSHPHVIQPIEVYKNRVIFYSLGNFIFDQTFSPKTVEGLSVGAVFEKDRATYYLFPITIQQFQAQLMSAGDRASVLKALADDSFVSENFKQEIADGKIVLE